MPELCVQGFCGVLHIRWQIWQMCDHASLGGLFSSSPGNTNICNPALLTVSYLAARWSRAEPWLLWCCDILWSLLVLCSESASLRYSLRAEIGKLLFGCRQWHTNCFKAMLPIQTTGSSEHAWTQEPLPAKLSFGTPDLVHSGGSQHLQVFVHLSSCTLKPLLSLTRLRSYSLWSSSSFVLVCWEREGGQSPSSFLLLEAKAEERQ